MRSKLLPYYKPAFDYLKEKLGDKGFQVHEDTGTIQRILSEHHLDAFQSVRRVGTYTSEDQKVKFIIIMVVSKKDFKLALETEGLLVIYDGHSRYGRGACFDTYTGTREKVGNQWEGGARGKEQETGLFRLAYPYVPVSTEDLVEHEYDFTPVPVEDGQPPNDSHDPYRRHPHARNVQLKKMTISAMSIKEITYDEGVKRTSTVTKNLEPHALVSSPSGQYYGVKIRGEPHLLLKAGWTQNANDPHDPCAHTVNLGVTNIVCKTFIHFGCSSRIHFWHIVRKKEYYGWERPSPPTDKYAYFTNYPSDAKLSPVWLYYLLTYDKENKDQPWWRSLEWTKEQTNRKLFTLGEPRNMVY